MGSSPHGSQIRKGEGCLGGNEGDPGWTPSTRGRTEGCGTGLGKLLTQGREEPHPVPSLRGSLSRRDRPSSLVGRGLTREEEVRDSPLRRWESELTQEMVSGECRWGPLRSEMPSAEQDVEPQKPPGTAAGTRSSVATAGTGSRLSSSPSPAPPPEPDPRATQKASSSPTAVQSPGQPMTHTTAPSLPGLAAAPSCGHRDDDRRPELPFDLTRDLPRVSLGSQQGWGGEIPRVTGLFDKCSELRSRSPSEPAGVINLSTPTLRVVLVSWLACHFHNNDSRGWRPTGLEKEEAEKRGEGRVGVCVGRGTGVPGLGTVRGESRENLSSAHSLGYLDTVSLSAKTTGPRGFGKDLPSWWPWRSFLESRGQDVGGYKISQEFGPRYFLNISLRTRKPSAPSQDLQDPAVPTLYPRTPSMDPSPVQASNFPLFEASRTPSPPPQSREPRTPAVGVVGQGRLPRAPQFAAQPHLQLSRIRRHISLMKEEKAASVSPLPSTTSEQTQHNKGLQRIPHNVHVEVGGLEPMEEAEPREQQRQSLRSWSPADTHCSREVITGIQPFSHSSAQGPRYLGSQWSGSWDPNPPATEKPVTSASQHPTRSNREPYNTGQGIRDPRHEGRAHYPCSPGSDASDTLCKKAPTTLEAHEAIKRARDHISRRGDGGGGRHHVWPGRWQEEAPEAAQEAGQGDGRGRYGIQAEAERGAEETRGAKSEGCGEGSPGHRWN
ncbi:hypothetical protein Cadr_000022161 [Camelus dromedarius]|uniref:Uncharacterized protein n=1 Tax=Camelus dromedarius TaxID=9838 RepID=A0A5N4CR53_CAMDR|nr:hypothetical protein Cadr_000022161 [Camelus dromedarius]